MHGQVLLDPSTFSVLVYLFLHNVLVLILVFFLHFLRLGRSSSILPVYRITSLLIFCFLPVSLGTPLLRIVGPLIGVRSPRSPLLIDSEVCWATVAVDSFPGCHVATRLTLDG